MKVVAKKSFAAGRQVIRKGDRYEDNDPTVKRFPDFFETAAEFFGVEKATANPGERRAATKPDLSMDNTKAELLAAAEGLDVDDSNTKAEILEALDAAE